MVTDPQTRKPQWLQNPPQSTTDTSPQTADPQIRNCYKHNGYRPLNPQTAIVTDPPQTADLQTRRPQWLQTRKRAKRNGYRPADRKGVDSENGTSQSLQTGDRMHAVQPQNPSQRGETRAEERQLVTNPQTRSGHNPQGPSPKWSQPGKNAMVTSPQTRGHV